MPLGDKAIAEATQLVMLNASSNPRVTTVAAFGATLIELYAAGNVCGIRDAGLTTATNLVHLNVRYNSNIQSVTPFASTLLDLDAYEETVCADAALVNATNLVQLNCSNSDQITTVAPFGKSLRHLVAAYCTALDDDGLTSATNLVTLDCRFNPQITSLAFCATSLQQLIAAGKGCGVQGSAAMTAMGPQLRVVDCLRITQSFPGSTCRRSHKWDATTTAIDPFRGVGRRENVNKAGQSVSLPFVARRTTKLLGRNEARVGLSTKRQTREKKKR